MCLNSNGSSLGNPGRAGIGYILRTDSGSFVGAGTTFVGKTTNNIAKLMALKVELLMDVRVNACRLIIQLDSQLVVNSINKGKAVEWRHRRLLDDIQHL